MKRPYPGTYRDYLDIRIKRKLKNTRREIEAVPPVTNFGIASIDKFQNF